MRRSRVRPGALACAVALALAATAASLTGCAISDPAPARTGEALPAGITVALLQLRSDVAARQAQVEVHNGSPQPVEIGDVVVVDDRFTEAATRVIDRTSTIPAGGTVNIPIQLPEMSCDAAADGTSIVELEFLEGDSESARSAPLPDRLGFLAPLHERECRAQALADAATVTLASFTPSPPGAPADLALEIAPTGEAAARIAAIQSTNLLTFGDLPAGSFPIDVMVAVGDTAATIVHLPLVPLRCDPHAVMEDKRGTVFSLRVELDGDAGLIQVAADEDMRGRILTWVGEWCGFGEG